MDEIIDNAAANLVPGTSYELDGVGIEKWIITHDPHKNKWTGFKVGAKVWADSIDNLLKQIIVN